MSKQREVPLARCNLLHEPRKLIASLGGIMFAVILMFTQIGFLYGVVDSQLALFQKIEADVFLASRWIPMYSTGARKFPFERLEQALAIEGVVAAQPLYIAMTKLKHPVSRHDKSIRVLAFDPMRPPFAIPAVVDQARLLVDKGQVLFDKSSRSTLGHFQIGDRMTLHGKSAHIVGFFQLGSDNSAPGNVIMSDLTYFDKITENRSGVDLGLLRLSRRADLTATVNRLRETLPEDVVVLTKEELLQSQRDYWHRTAPVGVVFGLGVILGLIIGMVICYQVLFTDVNDHLAEYATLKAIGYGKVYLMRVVAQQGVLLALIAFVPALAVADLLFSHLSGATGLLMRLTAPRVFFVLAITIGMCVSAAMLAVRKVLQADPAELFR